MPPSQATWGWVLGQGRFVFSPPGLGRGVRFFSLKVHVEDGGKLWKIVGALGEADEFRRK